MDLKNKRIILFDLDGTVTDSGPGIMNAATYVLKHFGITETDREKLKRFVGPPLKDSFREFYGVSEGVTDRKYYTNSFHVPVYQEITASEKINIEAPYHALANGGHISYVEINGSACGNIESFEKIIRMMKEAGIGYGAINHPVDRDSVCGFTGIIGDVCPSCGRTESDVPFERVRRITGYLVGTIDRFNDAKKAEEKDRVKHGL